MPRDEQARLEALGSYALMDTAPEEEFDHLVRLASQIFQVPTSLISLIENTRQFFKARIGFDACETGRDVSFCAHAIVGTGVLLVPDATKDPRFASNALVTGPPFIRFYAGAPLITPDGQPIGSLCVIDVVPRDDFTREKAEMLVGLAGLVMDRLEMRRLRLEQAISTSRFANISSTSPDAIVCADHNGTVTFWNSAAETLFGFSAQEAVGGTIDIIVPPGSRGGHDRGIARVAAGAKPTLIGKTIELTAMHKNGRTFPIELSLSMWNDNDGPGFGAIMRDITWRRENEDRLSRLAHRDALTDLPNRAALFNRLQETIAHGTNAGVLLLDLSGFKAINDLQGHDWGDQVLREVADRLRQAVPDEQMVARIGGDEFIVLADGEADPHALRALGERLLAAVRSPINKGGRSARLSASIGIALLPQHGESAEGLLSNVDLALLEAKRMSGPACRVFHPEMRDAARERQILEEQLAQALERDQFELFYQPQVRLSDNRIVGAEALLRWRHPVHGLMTPGAFIHVLDGLSIAGDVGNWAIRTACRQAAAWRAMGVKDFRVAVNLFGAQFARGDLIEVVDGALAQAGLPDDGLEIEITENIVLRHQESMRETLRELADRAISLAFDDFGTGFASLSQLKLFPLSKLKIDREFVDGMCRARGDAAVVQAVIDLADSFGYSVVAEGVESLTQHDALVAAGCTIGQGYLYGRPMDAEQFGRRLLEWPQVA
ncbi:putative bifunctional diguanylate cyclase/phosphodiesterase [Terrihabitans sp. B22-R8]|uniref:putative bifunctional diguanylate cyclase/phosphodiesterase n=1 Tax=Terrihabitans sp. B22-R8 TaxID=3425128 RepID=UPI00403D3874